MADEEGFKPDVPTGTALAVTSPHDARALVRRMSGDQMPDRCHFHCVMCGWSKTLNFDADEIAALGDNVRDYGGPCPGCGSMTLQPYDTIAGGAFKSVHEMATANKKKEYGEAADVFIEKVQGKVGEMFTGVMPGSTLGDPSPPPSSGPSREHLPEADDVDLSNMKPRKG
jgi:hypothetical protein